MQAATSESLTNQTTVSLVRTYLSPLQWKEQVQCDRELPSAEGWSSVYQRGSSLWDYLVQRSCDSVSTASAPGVCGTYSCKAPIQNSYAHMCPLLLQHLVDTSLFTIILHVPPVTKIQCWGTDRWWSGRFLVHLHSTSGNNNQLPIGFHFRSPGTPFMTCWSLLSLLAAVMPASMTLPKESKQKLGPFSNVEHAIHVD